MRFCLIFSTLWLALAAAQTPLCFPPLAFLSNSEGAEVPTIVATYERLLDTAGAKLTENVLARLRDGESPFAIKELSGEDLLALRRHLDEFREIVEKRGWDTPELRRAITTRLGDRMRTQEKSRNSSARAVIAMEGDRRVSVGGGMGARHGVSPDGAWVVAIESNLVPPPPFTPWKIVVHSVKTGETFTVPGPEGYYGVPAFDATGAYVLLPRTGFLLEKVPFSAGKLDFSRSEKVGTPEREGARDSVPGRIRRGASPNIVYADHFKKNETLLHRFDLSNNQRVTVDLATKFASTDHIHAWEVVPGTDQIAVTLYAKSGESMQVEVYKMDATGNLNRLKVYGPRALEPGVNLTGWTADGKLLFIAKGNDRPAGLYEMAEKKGAPKEILLVPRTTVSGWPMSPISFSERAGTDEVAFLYKSIRLTSHIAVWNRQTKTQVGLTEISPNSQSIEYTPDGGRLLVRQEGENGGYVVVVRPERITSP